ncbi:uncharacterized protein LOC135833947 isoform X2 [Planococcus citri]|uniref:uncharacterized protein LOC135833947 isoform X2 n=1 Tax=Planococcus citri TaxID=170843 RepID=UPI0031F81EAA
MPQKFEDLVMTKSLQTLACFTIAKELWSHREIKQRIDVCLRAQEFKNGNTYCFYRVPDQLLAEVHDMVKYFYPIVPIYFKQSISEIISFIGEDIFDWIIVSESHQGGIIQEMIIWNVRLTPFQTVDRIKSACLTQKFDFTSKTLCPCCYEKYVEKRWNKLDSDLKEKFEMFFGEYKFHAIAYWKCYVHVTDHCVIQEKIIIRNFQLFENFTPLENIFKISVYCGYDLAVVYYWNQMTGEQKMNNLNAVFCKTYSPISKLEMWMDRWTNEKVTSKAQISTFCFIWNQIPQFYRQKLMLFSYWSVFIMMIRWQIDDAYFEQIFDEWKPTFVVNRSYERTLRIAASYINKGEKHRKIFNLLWKPAESLYSNENIAEFIWVCMKYLTIYEDIESAAFIINKFAQRRKIQIMASLSQMLYVYNVNREYQTRLQDLLAAETAFEQPADEVTLNIDDLIQPPQDKQKISLVILFLIFLVYLFFIFICIITPASRNTKFRRFLNESSK